MLRLRLAVFSALLLSAAWNVSGQPVGQALANRHWFETRTAHFNLYSCGDSREVAKLAARLEQFREAYSLLAGGAPAVSSPPIVVMAFPDREAMEPFLPLYQGRPASMAAFFNHGADENLIVMALSGVGTNVMDVIYHEYTHLLLRHNDRFWPMWLKEGMAEIYSTFEVTGPRSARIGLPIDRHLSLLAEEPLMPLSELFSVTHDSPQYNESSRQGIFYAESWLLTHYLMLGDNPDHKARFGELTTLLRQGRAPADAFTAAFRTTLPAMDGELHAYLGRGTFKPLSFTVRADLTTPQLLSTRPIAPVETWFHLGDELLRVDQGDAAEACFQSARKLAPASPFPYEGLGFVAAQRDQPAEAVRDLDQSIRLGSTDYLAHYTCAEQRLRLTSSSDKYTRIDATAAAVIRAELQKSLALMPDFAPAHHLLGFFEMVQGDDLATAKAHLQRAVQLEPENESYELSLAQVQLRDNDSAAALRTLERLQLPYVDQGIRSLADELARQLGAAGQHAPTNP
jgi:tetratricopeptide (TPR) repeat protein